VSGNAGEGLFAYAHMGSITLADNIIKDNTSNGGYVESDNGVAVIVNNVITEIQTARGDSASLCLYRRWKDRYCQQYYKRQYVQI